MWEHINCRECDESPTGYCDAYDKAHREYEMHRRDRVLWNREQTPREKQLEEQLSKLVQNRNMSRAEEVQYDKLRFTSAIENRTPEEEVRRWRRDEKLFRRYVRYGLTPLEPEYLRRCDIEWLQSAIVDFDQRIANARAEGIGVGDPYLMHLGRMLRELRRLLRLEQHRAPAKAKAAHV